MHHVSGLQVCAPAVCGQEEVGSSCGKSERCAQAAQAEVRDGVTESGPLRMKQGLFSAVMSS